LISRCLNTGDLVRVLFRAFFPANYSERWRNRIRRSLPAQQRGIGSVKLPAFWANNPAAWFRSVEAQFVVKNVTDAPDKYYLVLASLG
jgi:hypothetical protein